MQKVLLSLSVALLLCSCANAEDKEKSLEKMTDEELIAKIMRLDKEQEKAKAKTAEMREKTAKMDERIKALDRLEKKVDELSKTLQVNK